MRILAQQSIPKSEQTSVPFTVLLRNNEDGTYSTHLRNDEDGGLIQGHYNLPLPTAWADFGQRILSAWPTRSGDFIAPEKKELVKVKRKLIPPIQIMIVRTEGPAKDVSIPAGQKITVNNYDEANDVIRRIARTAPPPGEFDKLNFDILFSDGFTYRGEYEVNHADMHRLGMLQEAIRLEMQFYIGEHRPPHTRGKGEAGWKAMMAQFEREGITQQAREFLDEYDVGQEVK